MYTWSYTYIIVPVGLLTGRLLLWLWPLILQVARAASLLEAATITVARTGSASGVDALGSSVQIPWQGSGKGEDGDSASRRLPLGVVMAVAHHLLGAGGTEEGGATSVGLPHLSKFARVRKPLCAVLTPVLLLLKSKSTAACGRATESQLPPRAGGGGALPEHWREMVSSGVGAGVSAVRQVLVCFCLVCVCASCGWLRAECGLAWCSVWYVVPARMVCVVCWVWHVDRMPPSLAHAPQPCTLKPGICGWNHGCLR